MVSYINKPGGTFFFFLSLSPSLYSFGRGHGLDRVGPVDLKIDLFRFILFSRTVIANQLSHKEL